MRDIFRIWLGVCVIVEEEKIFWRVSSDVLSDWQVLLGEPL